MAVRYLRTLSPAFAAQLAPDKALSWLKGLHRARLHPDPWGLGPELRECDKLLVYHGGTCLLTVSFRNATTGVTVGFSASEAYGERHRPSSQAYADLMRTWPLSEAAKLEDTCREYLAKAAESTDPAKYRNKKEGDWQSRRAHHFGEEWTEQKDWLVIDREVVLGFKDSGEHDRFLGPIRSRHEQITQDLRREDPDHYGTGEKSLGNELDLLALNSAGELLCIELKHGSNTSGVYWAPLQAGVYREAFETAGECVLDGARELLKQKVALGLLPPASLTWLPKDRFSAVRAIVAVAEPNFRSECWERLPRVQARVPGGPVPIVGFKPEVEADLTPYPIEMLLDRQ